MSRPRDLTSPNSRASNSTSINFNDEAVFKRYLNAIASAFIGTCDKFSFHSLSMIECARFMIGSLDNLSIHAISHSDVDEHLEYYDEWNHPDTRIAHISLDKAILFIPDSSKIYLALSSDILDKDCPLRLTEEETFVLEDSKIEASGKFIATEMNQFALDSIRDQVMQYIIGKPANLALSTQDKFRYLVQITVGALIAAMSNDDETLGRQERHQYELLYPYLDPDFHARKVNHYADILWLGEAALKGRLPFGYNLLNNTVFHSGPSYRGFADLPQLQALLDHFKIKAPIIIPFSAADKAAYIAEKNDMRGKNIRMFWYSNPNTAFSPANVNPPDSVEVHPETLLTLQTTLPSTSQSSLSFWNKHKSSLGYIMLGAAVACLLRSVY